jgi:complex iron-sulfur molybdoenzyme family reductase subunit gamma
MEQQAVAPQTETTGQPGETVVELDSAPVAPARRRFWYRGSPWVVLAVALIISAAMWAVDFQPVSSDTNKLTVSYFPNASDADLLNFQSPVWSENTVNKESTELDANGQPTNKVTTTIVPLSAQYIAAPQGGSVLQLRTRAVYNDNTMAVLVQWQDNTENFTSDVDKGTYSDAVAIEFPVQLVVGHQPFRCMGQSDANVAIWQWKAEREKAIAGDSTLVTSGGAVKPYIGPGIGLLKDTNAYNPDSNASYDASTHTWSVIFRRPLTANDEPGYTGSPGQKASLNFTGGTATTIAFAVWDGGAGERLSKKAVSTWVDFLFQPGDPTPQNIVNFAAVGGLGVAMIVAIALAWRFLPNPGRPRRE